MIGLNLLGADLDVEATQAAVEATVARLWAPFVTAESAARHQRQHAPRHVLLDSAGPHPQLLVDGDVVAARDDVPSLLGDFATFANRAALDACLDFAAHAAVVSTGAAVVAMPATSGVGKSTLTAACVQVGLRYVSDEALCVSYDDALVTPYPRPFSLSRWSCAALGLAAAEGTAAEESLIGPGELEGRLETARLPVEHLVVLARDASQPPRLVELPRTDAIAVLIRLSFNHYRRPKGAFTLLATLAGDVHAWTLHYGDPRSAANLLATRFS